MSEKRFEKRIREEVKKLKGLALKFFVFAFTGIPDRIVMLPGGRIWFVEVKSPGKKPTPRQLIVHDMLRNLGFAVIIVDSDESLAEFLNLIKLDK